MQMNARNALSHVGLLLYGCYTVVLARCRLCRILGQYAELVCREDYCYLIPLGRDGVIDSNHRVSVYTVQTELNNRRVMHGPMLWLALVARVSIRWVFAPDFVSILARLE